MIHKVWHCLWQPDLKKLNMGISEKMSTKKKILKLHKNCPWLYRIIDYICTLANIIIKYFSGNPYYENWDLNLSNLRSIIFY